MGRPLKIAKAQAVVAWSATNSTTDRVTVASTADIKAGMTFIPSKNGGGLTGGTTYWVLEVTSTTTFTVSDIPTDANVDRVPYGLTTATGIGGLITVQAVDTGFNNPNGPTNTYGVVGGNTAIYGNQVLVSVAIGVPGDGLVTSSTTSNVVYGAGTDFANALSVGSSIQSVDGQTIGVVATVDGATTYALTNAVSSGSFLITTSNTATMIVDAPIVLDGSLGGLSAGTVYFVESIANTTHFTVTTQPGQPALGVTNQNASVNAVQDMVTLTANAAADFPNGTAWVFADVEAGYILRQKGKQKYLVKGTVSGLVAQCETANVANAALTPNTMNIIGTYANSATKFVQSLSDVNAEVFGGDNTLPNSSPVYATFNTAAVANASNGQPYPVITINKA